MPFINVTINSVSNINTVSNTALTLKDLLPFVTTLLGVSTGAWLAYIASSIKDKKDTANKQYSALLATQYVLIAQMTTVEDLNKNLLQPERDNPKRHFILPYYFRSSGDLRIPLDQLTFILETEDRDLLQEIHIAEKHYLRCLELLEKLNALKTKIQDREPLKFDPTTGKGDVTISSHEAYNLKDFTDKLYDHVDKARGQLTQVGVLLSKFAKENFKKRKFFGWTLISPNETKK
jgi:hypothetical protein